MTQHTSGPPLPKRPPPPSALAAAPEATGVTALPGSVSPPVATGAMTEDQKEALTLQALGLLNEQVEARIVHYRADLETSPELDAITAQVVQQFRAMQALLEKQPTVAKTPEEIEAQQVETLTALLLRVFNPSSQFTTHVLKPVGRRVAKLFFQSELHQKTRGDKDKVIHHAEQGLYYVLQRYKHRLRAELDGFAYETEDIRALTLELLAKTERELQIGFLSRRSPELNRVMTIYTAVLSDFLQLELPSRVEQMGRLTLRAARTGERPNSVGYKVLDDAFPAFRQEWERRFMQQMVFFCGDELLSRLKKEGAGGRGESDGVREETVRFFTDPHVFSETCQVLCEELYDFLCLEGFLDLPLDWRVGRERTA